MPVGAFARISEPDKTMSVIGMVANLDGSVLLQDVVSGTFTDLDSATTLGTELAERLLSQGCKEILDQILAQSTPEPEPLP